LHGTEDGFEGGTKGIKTLLVRLKDSQEKEREKGSQYALSAPNQSPNPPSPGTTQRRTGQITFLVLSLEGK